MSGIVSIIGGVANLMISDMGLIVGLIVDLVPLCL